MLNNPAIEIDGIQYAKAAEAFITGQFGAALGNVFSPGYPLFIGLIHLLVPDLELAGRLVSVVFGTLLIWLSFLLAKRVLKDDGKAVWLSFLVAFHPYLIRYSGEVLSESLATFLFTLAVFLFYSGLQEKKSLLLPVSGFCLSFAYLTRPEYLIFYAPLILTLLWRRRVIDSTVFLLPLLVLGSLYVWYLHSQTGLWIVSNKATLSPFVSLSAAFANIPVVFVCFLTAISPLFLAFAVIGFRKMDFSFKILLVLLVIFHILSLSLIGHATKRYSVEFVPLCLVSAAEGIYIVVPYLGRFLKERLVYRMLVFIILVSSVCLAYLPMHYNRILHKRAGLFLLSHDPGATIAARLPLVAFYAKGRNVDLLSEMSGERTAEQLKRILVERRVKYLVFDEKLERQLTFVSPYLTQKQIVWSVEDRNSFIRIYRLM